MEALSPLDPNANVNRRTKQPNKIIRAALAKVAPIKPVAAKPAPAKQLPREKDHPPPPPEQVLEPPSSDRKHGAIYQTGRLLGKGGFAICYEGGLKGSSQKVAMKIVKSHMPQKKMEQKFQTELQIHSKMKHANIVQFHRAFTFQECTYLILELCPNGSLMDMVKKRKFVTEPEVRFYTVQMAGAIKYMHSKGIIHRDLKMGNIFLDKDMNVKIGDFGLAAMLLSGKDMTTIRRTTLCGTPNYIAPEILEKGKKGHDHAVDIWSLGIIIFAMLTGRPPFQSSTQEEIYRKARERDYDWPQLNTSENCISQEAKDLVSELLQDPESRPGPDRIVQHPFFSCGWVPQWEEITPNLRENAPDPAQFSSVGLRTGRATLYARNLKKLCIKSDVGPYSSNQQTIISTYKEVTEEEKAGLTPAVPLPDNIVYRPFDEMREEIEKTKGVENSRQDHEQAHPSPARPSTQSFAAQQRAQHQPTASISTLRQPKPRTTVTEQRGSVDHIDNMAEAEILARARVERKTRHVSTEQTMGKSRGLIALTSRTQKSTRQASSQPIVETLKKEIPASREPVTRIEPRAAEGRLGMNIIQEPSRAREDRKSQEEYEAPVLSTDARLSLFSPTEKQETFPATRADRVLESLRSLHTELERALKSKSMSRLQQPPNPSPVIVVKWVDYTNKFGLGYILSTGSVGCIFTKSTATSGSRQGFVPPTCIVVRNAETHLQQRSNPDYPDRHQLVPVSGADIEFYENKGDAGVSRVKVNPRSFAVTVGTDGKVGTFTRGKDEFEDRKRQKIVLWKKFANYMTAFGKDQDYPYDYANSRAPQDSSPESDVVTFYQRFGDVGCWGFCDGHFQFNFPDHTKIIISADGTWCDFYHLSLEAARDLSINGTISPTALDDRRHLSYPVQTLLNFMAKTRAGTTSRAATTRLPVSPMAQGVPAANDFRRKIEFINQIISEWIKNGGMGRNPTDPENRPRWLGYRECVNVKTPYKHVWATVGASGGDDRRAAWFDPRNPEDIVPDIEV